MGLFKTKKKQAAAEEVNPKFVAKEESKKEVLSEQTKAISAAVEATTNTDAITEKKAYVAQSAGAKLELQTLKLSPLQPEQVTVKVISTGLCHSDYSNWKNEWGIAQYPFVGGHEIIGEVVELGPNCKTLKVGQKVGVGWFSGSCMTCGSCMSGEHNFCPKIESTIVGRDGGFANYVRAQESWAVPLPDNIDAKTAGPLFCAGITVFSPIVEFDVKPTNTVGVVGIGGLGHLAVQMLNKWGCHVAAFTSSPEKAELAKKLGAHEIIDSTKPEEMLANHAGRFDFILVTSNVELNWDAFNSILKPKGRLNLVGVVTKPLQLGVFPLLLGQKSVSASPLGPPATVYTMLEFCARHNIKPMVEEFPMSKINKAMDYLENGKPKFRIVLTNDIE